MLLWGGEIIKTATEKNLEHPQNQHVILYGQPAKQEAIMYADGLVTTMNHAIPDETWRLPPCTHKATDIDAPSRD